MWQFSDNTFDAQHIEDKHKELNEQIWGNY